MSIVHSTRPWGAASITCVNTCKYCKEVFPAQVRSYKCGECRSKANWDPLYGPNKEWTAEEIMVREG